jgi:3-oxoacyl-[acyl-carrier protein] reductase
MNMPGDRVVITGGEGDLAREIAAHLTEHGFKVDSPGRDRLEVTRPDMVKAYFGQRETDLLICNAGVTRDQALARLTENDWDEVIGVNLKGAIHCASAAIQSMKSRGGGSVVFVSSYSALHPPIGQSAYAASKASLLGLVSELAQEVGEHNIRVNAILPGFLETKMTKSVRESRKGEVFAQHALGRLNTLAQVAAFIRFLHEELIHTSGQVFQLDSRIP